MITVFMVNGKIEVEGNILKYERDGVKEYIKDKYAQLMLLTATRPITKNQFMDICINDGKSIKDLEKTYNYLIEGNYIYEDVNFNGSRAYQKLIKTSKIMFCKINQPFYMKICNFALFLFQPNKKDLKRFFSFLLSEKEDEVLKLIKKESSINFESILNKVAIDENELVNILYEFHWCKMIYTEKIQC